MSDVYQKKAATFVQRLPSGTPDEVVCDIELAFRAPTAFLEKAEKIRSDKRLSTVGQREALVGALKGEGVAGATRGGMLGHLKHLRGTAERQLEELRETRATLRPTADRTDMFAEMQRQEVRTWLRSLPEADRLRIAYETTDQTTREAIAFASPALSGISDEAHANVLSLLTTDKHGAALARVNHLEEIYDTQVAAIDEAARDLHRVSGLDEREFSAIWEDALK